MEASDGLEMNGGATDVGVDVGDPPVGQSVGVESRMVTVFGHRMRYLTAGQGEPVLLLHGLADVAESWARVLPALATRYQVIAPDLLGCGLSDKPRIPYHLWALATYTRHLLDAMGVERAHVVGHSLGGALALHLYFQYPERVRDLALIAPGGMGRHLSLPLRLCTLAGASPVMGALLNSRHAQHPAARAARGVLQRFWPATAIADQTAPREDVTDEAEAALLAADEAGILDRLCDSDTRAAFLAMLRSSCDIRGQRETALEALRQVEVPVLLIHGARDATIPVSHSHAARAALRQASLEVIDACGHCPQREAPKRVVTLLEAYLRAPEAVVAMSRAAAATTTRQ
jgi:pimeloyl-ACP methyl ester carboxylesterase